MARLCFKNYFDGKVLLSVVIGFVQVDNHVMKSLINREYITLVEVERFDLNHIQ